MNPDTVYIGESEISQFNSYIDNNTTPRDYPGYYGILPASVRYCQFLTDFEKILYTEITSLSNKNGFCHARNKYFEDLYNCSTSKISRSISNLKKYGFIKTQIFVKQNTNQILMRKIFPVVDPVNTTTQMTAIVKNDHTPMLEIPNSDEKTSENTIQITAMSKNDHTPIVKNDHTPIVKNDKDNNINLNNINLKASQPAILITNKILELFQAEYYPLSDNFSFELENLFLKYKVPFTTDKIDSYLDFIFEKTQAQNPANFPGLFYKMCFYADVFYEHFFQKKPTPKNEKQPETETKTQKHSLICPVCGTENTGYVECRNKNCGFDLSHNDSQAEINIFRQIFNLSHDIRQNLDAELQDVERKSREILSDGKYSILDKEYSRIVTQYTNDVYTKYGIQFEN